MKRHRYLQPDMAMWTNAWFFHLFFDYGLMDKRAPCRKCKLVYNSPLHHDRRKRHWGRMRHYKDKGKMYFVFDE